MGGFSPHVAGPGRGLGCGIGLWLAITSHPTLTPPSPHHGDELSLPLTCGGVEVRDGVVPAVLSLEALQLPLLQVQQRQVFLELRLELHLLGKRLDGETPSKPGTP